MGRARRAPVPRRRRSASLRRALGVSVGSEGRERPTMHVLTETPRSLRRMLDCPVRVHALVRAGGVAGAVELN